MGLERRSQCLFSSLLKELHLIQLGYPNSGRNIMKKSILTVLAFCGVIFAAAAPSQVEARNHCHNNVRVGARVACNACPAPVQIVERTYACPCQPRRVVYRPVPVAVYAAPCYEQVYIPAPVVYQRINPTPSVGFYFSFWN